MQAQRAQESISVDDAKRDLEEIVQRVSDENDEVILEVDGAAKSVVVSVEAYKEYMELKWQRRQEAYDRILEIAERVNMSEEEAAELVEEAIQTVRSGKDA
jgi:prevent-host-death family protein